MHVSIARTVYQMKREHIDFSSTVQVCIVLARKKVKTLAATKVTTINNCNISVDRQEVSKSTTGLPTIRRIAAATTTKEEERKHESSKGRTTQKPYTKCMDLITSHFLLQVLLLLSLVCLHLASIASAAKE